MHRRISSACYCDGGAVHQWKCLACLSCRRPGHPTETGFDPILKIEQWNCACSNISVSASTRNVSLCQGHHERGCRQRTIASYLPGCAPHCHGGAPLTFHAQPNKKTANEALSPHRQHREGFLRFWDDTRNSNPSSGPCHRLRLAAHLVDERSPQSPAKTPELAVRISLRRGL